MDSGRISVQGKDRGKILIFHSGFSRDFDGPGNRLIFYLKGCDFHCDWCASPESISPAPEMLFYRERNRDEEGYSCPHGAMTSAGVDRERCRKCEKRECVTVWHNPALEWAGTMMETAEVLRRTEAAGDFISGVTFGGGEPTLQADALLPLCRELRRRGFHTALESNASTAGYREFIGEVDLLYSDLKTLSPEIARRRMGADISMVAGNLRLAAAGQEDFILRIPVVAGVNAERETWSGITDFCRELAALRPAGRPLKVQLLRQHHLGEPKYAALGKVYQLAGSALPGTDVLEEFSTVLKQPGTEISIFG